MLPKRGRILDTTPSRDEADQLEREWAAKVRELDLQAGWGVYVQPYRIHGRRNWWFAVCVGPQDT
jgi:hypothetical protein